MKRKFISDPIYMCIYEAYVYIYHITMITENISCDNIFFLMSVDFDRNFKIILSGNILFFQ